MINQVITDVRRDGVTINATTSNGQFLFRTHTGEDYREVPVRDGALYWHGAAAVGWRAMDNDGTLFYPVYARNTEAAMQAIHSWLSRSP